MRSVVGPAPPESTLFSGRNVSSRRASRVGHLFIKREVTVTPYTLFFSDGGTEEKFNQHRRKSSLVVARQNMMGFILATLWFLALDVVEFPDTFFPSLGVRLIVLCIQIMLCLLHRRLALAHQALPAFSLLLFVISSTWLINPKGSVCFSFMGGLFIHVAGFIAVMIRSTAILTFPWMVGCACTVPANHLLLLVLHGPLEFGAERYVLVLVFYILAGATIGRGSYFLEKNIREKFLLKYENKHMQRYLDEDEELHEGHFDSPLERVLGKLERLVQQKSHRDSATASTLRVCIKSLRSTENVYVPDVDQILKRDPTNTTNEGFALFLANDNGKAARRITHASPQFLVGGATNSRKKASKSVFVGAKSLESTFPEVTKLSLMFASRASGPLIPFSLVLLPPSPPSPRLLRQPLSWSPFLPRHGAEEGACPKTPCLSAVFLFQQLLKGDQWPLRKGRVVKCVSSTHARGACARVVV